MGKRCRYRKRKGMGGAPLFPSEWTFSLCERAGRFYPITPPWNVARGEAQTYLSSCFGNIYTRVKFDTYGQAVPQMENHMLLSAFVGAGAYLGLTWLDLQTNRKWDESVRMEGQTNREWSLVSEMKTKEDM